MLAAFDKKCLWNYLEWQKRVYNRSVQLDVFQFDEDVSPLIPEASSLLTIWRRVIGFQTLCVSVLTEWEYPYIVWEYPYSAEVSLQSMGVPLLSMGVSLQSTVLPLLSMGVSLQGVGVSVQNGSILT